MRYHFSEKTPSSVFSTAWELRDLFRACMPGVVREQICCQFDFSILEFFPVQNFGAIKATTGIWQHIAIFAWWHVQVIFNPSTIKLHIKKIGFCFLSFSHSRENPPQYHHHQGKTVMLVSLHLKADLFNLANWLRKWYSERSAEAQACLSQS